MICWRGVVISFAVLASAGPTPVAAAPFAYIANFGDNTVSVIDTETDTVTATVPVGASAYGVAVHPAGTRVYVTNTGEGTVSMIDMTTNAVTATIAVGGEGIAVSTDGARLYVVNGEGSVSVVDTATNQVTSTIPLGFFPAGIAVNP